MCCGHSKGITRDPIITIDHVARACTTRTLIQVQHSRIAVTYGAIHGNESSTMLGIVGFFSFYLFLGLKLYVIVFSTSW